MEQFSSSPTYLLQALSDDLQHLFGGLLSPRSQAPPKTEDPRNEDPPWLALIQQLVDGKPNPNPNPKPNPNPNPHPKSYYNAIV